MTLNSIIANFQTFKLVDLLDITRAQRCYGMNEGDKDWNPLADVNSDHVVDINDLILILNNYTK